MVVDKDQVINLLKLRKTGKKGWFISEQGCPWCASEEKLAVIFDSKVPSFVCKKCGTKGIISKLLFKVGRPDLVQFYKTTKADFTIENKIRIEESDAEDLNYHLDEISLPIGFKRLKFDAYLNERGFTPEQYDVFGIGESKLDPRVKDNYVIFQVKDYDDRLVGYLCRKRLSKKEIEALNEPIKVHNQKIKKGLKKGKFKPLILRYMNSENDFEKMLGGCNEIIVGTTRTVILVEGVTDKSNIDKLLDLYRNDELKCCFTFSNKISKFQIKILQDLEVQNVILLYDSDKLNLNKQAALEINRYFNTLVGFIGNDKDPGEFTSEDINEVLNNLEGPVDYYLNKVHINI